MNKFLFVFLLVSNTTIGASFKSIPLPTDVKSQAELTSTPPYVFSGFTHETEVSVLTTISEKLGKPTKTSTRFNRTTYYFDTDEGEARVTLTKNGQVLQIDVMVQPI